MNLHKQGAISQRIGACIDIARRGQLNLSFMRDSLEKKLRLALQGMGVPAPEHIEVEVPRDETHGDLSTPVAMSLARQLKRNPRQIAQDIADRLSGDEIFQRIEVAGPGFINFTFKPAHLCSALAGLLSQGHSATRGEKGRGQRIQVEFVSANPTGPLHLGHGRGAAVGAALANLLKAAGYDVVREYYVNDAGLQMKLLAESVFLRAKQLSLPDMDIKFLDDGYKGEYVYDIARAYINEKGDDFKDKVFADVREDVLSFSLDMMLEVIKADLKAFGVEFDTWQSEQAMHTGGAVKRTLDALRQKGLVYEADGALWFSAEKFGDDKDRVVEKSDGEHTYFASDIAYHAQKIQQGFDEIIDVWGADHHGYVPRLEAVIEALGYERKRLRVVLVQMVSLLRAGQPVQMSKRAGEFVTLKEVIDEVGADTTKFIFLTRRSDSQLAFDLEVAVTQSSENPVFYVQYANARIASIFKHASELGIDPAAAAAGADLSALTQDEELRIIRKLLAYPMTLEDAALAREPHRITFYVQELAGLFHPYYNKHRVITGDARTTAARLALCTAIKTVIAEGLSILGITAPDKM